jgi:hypothetical protein
MTSSRLNQIKTHLTDHFTLYLSLAIILLTFIVSTQFPVYYRQGDTEQLEPIIDVRNPLTFFNPGNLIIGHFRPVVYLTEWTFFHLFGLNPFPHYAFNLLLYGFSFVVFFKLVELVFLKRVAIYSLASYFAVFFWIAYVPFSIGFVTYILEIFFLSLSLYFLISAIKGRHSFIWGILFSLCASLSKESSLIIVPAALSFYLLTEWSDLPPETRKKSLALLGLLWAFGFAGVMISPFGFTSEGVHEKIAFIHKRWSFYSGHLLSNFGILIWFSVFYLSFRSIFLFRNDNTDKSFYIPLIAAISISLILRPFHDAALLFLFIAFIPLVLKRHKVSFAFIWFAISLLGFIKIPFMSRTYLTDASLGIAIVMGVAVSDIMSNLNVLRLRLPPRIIRVILPASLAVLCLGIFSFTLKIKDKIDVLYVVSANRVNYKNMMDFISANLKEDDTSILVVDYEDMGINYFDDIHHLDDLNKARLQKVMKLGSYIERWLRLLGKNNIRIYNLEWFYNNHDIDKSFLMAMNNHEINFVEGLNLTKEIVYESEKDGERAIMFYVQKNSNPRRGTNRYQPGLSFKRRLSADRA